MRMLYIDNHLLAVDKPAGVPSQPDASGDPALIDMAREWVRKEFDKPGNVYLALLHRLDRPVSGVVLLARTDKAAGRMAERFRTRGIDKRYLALTACAFDPGKGGALVDRLAPGPSGNMVIARTGASGGREARLRYETLAADGAAALLEIDLETGVKHQIRAQLAKAGFPVAGDFRYGPFGKPARPEPVMNGGAILLHAARIGFEHPVGKGRITVDAALPSHWDAPLRRHAGFAAAAERYFGRRG